MDNKYNINNKIIDCPFCNIDKTQLVNTILDETKFFYITPTLGSLVEGYILLTSKRHINSMSELTIEEMKEYQLLIDKYRKIFKAIYKKYPIVFEHGTPNLEDKIKASSVVHAHTHIVNYKYENEKELFQQLNFKQINNVTKINSKNNYIFYINTEGKQYITYKFEPISQFMRIQIAKNLNLLNKYDWRKNIFYDNIILTITEINNYFNNEISKGSDNNE